MALRSARARGREWGFESPLPTSGLHSPRNELGLLALNDSEEVGSKQKCWRFVHSHEDLLTAFSLSADLLLRSRLYAFAERKVLLKHNTLGEAVNRRSEKNVQQRRPPPVADTGRSCWGRGQQDASGSEADAGSRNPS